MKPRIAAITGAYGAHVQNGVGRFLSGLHRWSLANGLPLHVFSSGDHVRAGPGLQNIHALAFPVPGGFKAVEAYYPLEGRRKQLRRTIEQLDPDVVHISTPEAIGMTGLWIARKQKRPLAGVYHTDFPSFANNLVRDAVERLLRQRGAAGLAQCAFDPLWQWLYPVYEGCTRWWQRWLLGFVLRRVLRRNRERIDAAARQAADWLADGVQSAVREALAQFYGRFNLVIARSETYREKLLRDLYLSGDRVRTLRAGVDATMFSPQPSGANAGLRERLGVPCGQPVVLYVGRLTDEKNVGFLADAWRAFRNQGNGAVFVAAGSGNLEEFRRRAGDGVYAIGPHHGASLSAIYRMADAFWTGSANETLGQVVLEAQASGLPTIVSDQGAARENVRDGRTGRVLPVDSPVRWARELRSLLADEGRRAMMGRAARDHAAAHPIEASYQHYWDLHAELHERTAFRSSPTGSGTSPAIARWTTAASRH
ncbi:MAG TPA: glycosyltransferase [Gemmataceae bacterium]|nr:glycosyltransferase [Gemmataceae bacterium]